LGKLESTIKSEIQRLSKREIRATFVPLRREVRGMRLRLSSLSKNFSTLNRLAKEQMQNLPKKGLEATPEEVKAYRLTPERIRGLRKKLGISMRELGLLIGVTTWAVLMWEKGKFKPKAEKKAALVALKKFRKREVRKILAEKADTTIKAIGRRPKVRIRRKKPGKRVIRRRK
jgi:DNA-binding transcriptional regulator YiaG